MTSCFHYFYAYVFDSFEFTLVEYMRWGLIFCFSPGGYSGVPISGPSGPWAGPWTTNTTPSSSVLRQPRGQFIYSRQRGCKVG